MKRYSNYFVIIFLAMLVSSCLKEDHFGVSSDALITNFEVHHQVGDAQIKSETKSILVELSGSVFLSHATIKKLGLSSFASSDLDVDSVLDLSSTAYINVYAEDGTLSTWSVDAIVEASHPQIRNNLLNYWYQTSSGYFEPAESEIIQTLSPVWSTNNEASNSIGVIPVVPFEIKNDNLAAHIVTMDNGTSSIKHGRISPGKLFTGTFNKLKHHADQPASGIEAGIEFTGRPDAFHFKYQYLPGSQNMDKDGNELSYSDGTDVYILLEVRDSTNVRRLATAWFRSQVAVENMTDENVKFTYGPLNNSYPDYMMPANGQFVPEDSAAFVLPTHLVFMATPSFAGDSLAGAVGSVLVVDDIRLEY